MRVIRVLALMALAAPVAVLGKDPEPAVWELERAVEGTTRISVTGNVVYGDRHTFVFSHGECYMADQVFAVSSTLPADFSRLEGKAIRITVNGERAAGLVIGTYKPSTYLTVVLFDLGAFDVVPLSRHLAEHPEYVIKLVGSQRFDPADYFDVLENSWDFTGVRERLIQAVEACLVQPSTEHTARGP